MNKTGNDFRKAAIQKGLDWWGVHGCSLCGYECGFIFFAYENAEVVFDHGCDCTGQHSRTKRDWDSVADHYNMNRTPEFRAKYDKMWGFIND